MAKKNMEHAKKMQVQQNAETNSILRIQNTETVGKHEIQSSAQNTENMK